MGDPEEYAQVLLRMQGSIKIEFPIGCRVTMTEAGLKQFPKYSGKIGTVVAYSGTVSPKVLWDGRKTAVGYAPWFVTRTYQEPSHD